MGKAKRKHGARLLGEFFDQSWLEEQGDRQLDAEEDKLQKRQRWITGLGDVVLNGKGYRLQDLSGQNLAACQPLTAEHVLRAFRILHGNCITHAQVRYRRPRRGSTFPEVVGAVIEFRDAATAESTQKNKCQFLFIDSDVDWEQRVLQLDLVGALRRKDSYDGNRYVRFWSELPPVNSSQHYFRGGTGERSLRATRLQIGSYGPDGTTLITELDYSDPAGKTQLVIDYQKRQLTVLTYMRGKHLLVNKFRDVRRRLSFDRDSCTLTFTVTQPPQVLEPYSETCPNCSLSEADLRLSGPLYQLAGDPTAEHKMGMVRPNLCPMCASDYWNDEEDPDWAINQPSPRIGAPLAGADGVLGRCFTYRLRLHPSTVRDLDERNNQFLRKLSSFRLITDGNYYRWQRSQQRAANKSSQPTAAQAAVTDSQQASAVEKVISRKEWEAKNGPCRLEEMLSNVEFAVGYNVLVLLSSGAASMWQISTPEFERLLRQSSSDLACEALLMLAASRLPLVDATAALEQQLKELAELQETAEEVGDAAADSKLCRVLRVHVTPTRLKFLPAEVQSGNRVIRHFCSPEAANRRYPPGLACLDWLRFSNDNFLRVSFGDEHGDRATSGTREEVGTSFYKRMYYTLSKGIVVNGQEFAFLAYSSSQLRTWSCWMVADPNQDLLIAAGADQIADALRLWLGNAMYTIFVPGKCAARLGQGFSTTVDAAVMAEHEVEAIDDVYTGNDEGYYAHYDANGGLVVSAGENYCFSDGVGRISTDLLDAVLQELPFVSVDLGPISAIQIRFGGHKGVLSRYSALAGRSIQLRPSMCKFGSDHPQLEVVTVAAYRPVYLNRQVITMMSHNGVPEQAFLSKLEAYLNQLNLMTSNIDAALDLLPSLGNVSPAAQDALIRLLNIARACNLVLDPLMNSCLRAVTQWQVTGLRQKARLLVREGATLMGVMDEYGVLEGDEVFVQVVKPHRGKRTHGPAQIITGKITLAKHPVAHRGDTRQVEAVNPYHRLGGLQLINDYTNVIVFSQKGERPLPNKLAGADLDGDMFVVIWDEDLLQPRNSEPMDYSADKPREVDKVEVHHLQEHFVNCIRSDNLGMISNWILVHADRDGADCVACDRLAQLHSVAVDFPKTGKPAYIGPNERRILMPPELAHPHWLEKPDKDYYHSDTVLGKMYDMVKDHPINKQLEESKIQQHSSSPDSSSSVCSRHNRAVAAGNSSDGSKPVVNGHDTSSSNGVVQPVAASIASSSSYRPLFNGSGGGMYQPLGGVISLAPLSLQAANGNHRNSFTMNGSSNSSGVDDDPWGHGAAAAGDPQAAAQQQQQQLWPEQLLHAPGVAPGYRRYLHEAGEHYIEFENDVIQLMNQSDVCDVGEMLTCCVGWLQTTQTHQQYDQKEHLFSEVKTLFTAARRRYLLAVLQHVGAAQQSEHLRCMRIKALEAKVKALFVSSLKAGADSSEVGSSVNLQLAAAYMVVANKHLIKQQAEQRGLWLGSNTALVGSSGLGVYGRAAGVVISESESEYSETEDETDADDSQPPPPAAAAADGSPQATAVSESAALAAVLDADDRLQRKAEVKAKVSEIKKLVRLAFQWVVARELQELADYV